MALKYYKEMLFCSLQCTTHGRSQHCSKQRSESNVNGTFMGPQSHHSLFSANIPYPVMVGIPGDAVAASKHTIQTD